MKDLSFSLAGADEPNAAQTQALGFSWIIYNRAESIPQVLLDTKIHENHHEDLTNSLHSPYFEQTEDYELIVFRALDRRFPINEPRTRAISFVLLQNAVITVHDEDDQTLDALYQRLEKSRSNRISDSRALFHVIIDEIVKQFIQIREPLDNLASDWQQKLLDPDDPFDDWQIILQARSKLRGFNTTLNLQSSVLLAWKDNTKFDLSESHSIKFNDSMENLSRVERLTDNIRSDLDSLAQMYFASTGQKTNSNVQLLAVISAIFLPLNLIAGLFGMNFDSMPFLEHPGGPYLLVALMLSLTFLLLWWFKKHNWF